VAKSRPPKLIVGWRNDDVNHFTEINLFWLVSPSLQHGELWLFPGIGYMVPQPFADGGNQLYLGVFES
jgi:hypothetical protein